MNIVASCRFSHRKVNRKIRATSLFLSGNNFSRVYPSVFNPPTGFHVERRIEKISAPYVVFLTGNNLSRVNLSRVK